MKRATTYFTLIVIVLSMVSLASAGEKVDWQAFSKNLTMALKSPNTGLQISAMQKVIQYADKVIVDDAALDLVKLYRNNKDDRVRQLALVTIHAIDNDWALNVVKRDFAYEKSAQIKKVMAAIIVAQDKKNTL